MDKASGDAKKCQVEHYFMKKMNPAKRKLHVSTPVLHSTAPIQNVS